MNVFCETKNHKLRKSFLKEMSCNDCYFRALFEIALNISNGKLKLKAQEKKKLRKEARIIERILAKPKSEHRRALVVKQSGGFLSIVIPAVITGLSEILRNAIS